MLSLSFPVISRFIEQWLPHNHLPQSGISSDCCLAVLFLFLKLLFVADKNLPALDLFENPISLPGACNIPRKGNIVSSDSFTTNTLADPKVTVSNHLNMFCAVHKVTS